MNPEKFLNSLVNYEKVPGYKYDLEAYKRFLERLGSPHKNLKNVVLIAGTKGKGSTATIINSCLIANGYKVGLFTSPHLKKINERIKINNQEISKQKMNKYIKIIKPHIKNCFGARTFFEVLTTIAFMHFAEEEVDFAILEVGLGGRLDATNVFYAHIPVITRIGYDHMNLLGNKLSQIAYEKAGIITDSRLQSRHRSRDARFSDKIKILEKTAIADGQKIPLNSPLTKGERGGFVITIHQRPSVEKVLKRIARERKNEIIYADELHRIKIKRMMLSGTKMRIKNPLGEFDTFLPLAGRHQIENLSIALTVLNELKNRGFEINLFRVKKGIAQTQLPGRLEIISEKPLIIYDVAHNEDSFKALHNNLKLLFSKNSSSIKEEPDLYIIFGCNKDKNITYATKNIFPKAKEALLVKADNPRAMEPIEIYNKAKKYQKNLVIAGSTKNALEYINSKANNNLAILIFGSFYLYSDLNIY